MSAQNAKQATCGHALTDSDRWACQRKAFGKPLTSQPVVRYKLANMIAKVEALQAWLETITFQMCNMVSGADDLCPGAVLTKSFLQNYKEQSKYLAG